jgi:hypothetical protein
LAAEVAEHLKKNGPAPRIAAAAPVAAAAPKAEPPTNSLPRAQAPAPVAARPSAAVEAPARAVSLSPAEVQNLWGNVLEGIQDMLADRAAIAEGASFQPPNKVVVAFAKRNRIHKDFCERPEQLGRLTQALSEAAGAALKLEFTLVDDPAEPTQKAAPRGAAKQEKLREKVQQPFVRKAIELFDARPVEVDDAP